MSHQGRFIHGRQTTDHILEIDTVALSYSMQRGTETEAVLVDQEKAFVKIARLFLFAAFWYLGCPMPVVTSMIHL